MLGTLWFGTLVQAIATIGVLIGTVVFAMRVYHKTPAGDSQRSLTRTERRSIILLFSSPAPIYVLYFVLGSTLYVYNLLLVAVLLCVALSGFGWGKRLPTKAREGRALATKVVVWTTVIVYIVFPIIGMGIALRYI